MTGDALTNGQRITVYPLPPVLTTNPYFERLYAPMRGTRVLVRQGRPRYELPRLLLGRGARVLHLHFFDELTQRPGRIQTAVRSIAFLLLLALLKLHGVRLVWTAHNLAPHEVYHPGWSFLVYRLVGHWSDAVIAHGAVALTLFAGRYGPFRRSVVIPQGHYIGVYGPRCERGASRAALGLPLHGPVLLCVGALRPYKQIEALIDAFAALPEVTRGTLLIAGAAKVPGYAAELVRRGSKVPGVVVRAEYVPDEALAELLAAADVVVLPYRSLLTSAALLMALSYGRPVVAPAFAPVRELVRNGVEGFLFEPADTASLRDALARAAGRSDSETLEHAALARAASFDWDEIAAKTAAVYAAVCDR